MAETDFKYDVFISYSHKDEEWVINTLLPALEIAGLRVCIDYRDFDAGKPSIVNMEDAVDESRHTVLVLTPNWTGSEWTDFEAVLTQTDDPVGRRQKMIPIMLEKCTPPKRVRSFTYVDFMRSDRLNNAWTQLFKALGKPNAPIPTSVTKTPTTGSRDKWYLAHPYPMPPNFTGRVAEQTMLDDWLGDNTNRLFILRALGGFGKSALAWQWINAHVDPAEWTKLVFWSFYEGDASFEHFIEETLKYLKLEVPQGGRPQVDALLKAMQSQKILLIMDGFERALRAYSSMNAAYQGDEPKIEDNQLDCVNINAEFFLKGVCSLPNIKSKVLMSTRLTPRAVKPRGEFMLGCREQELTAMQKADAVEFFHKQKIKGTHAEIEAACAPYGYHPLSLRLLTGRILKDFDNPADIVVAQKLKIDGDMVQQKHHVLKVSYNSLPPQEQKLLSTIACFRSPVELKTLQVVAENKDTLDNDLHDLISRGLLHFDEKNKKFDIHPIVRRFAYERLTTPDRAATHTRLRDYFAAVDVPVKIQSIDDLAPVIELYHHTVQAGEYNTAFMLFKSRLATALHFQLGAYETRIELLRALFQKGEDNPPSLKDEVDQGWVLNALAISYSVSGQPNHAIPLKIASIQMLGKKVDKQNLAIGLGNLARNQIQIGGLQLAESNLQWALEISRTFHNKVEEGSNHSRLATIYITCGQWEAVEREISKLLDLATKEKHSQLEEYAWLYRSQCKLLMARDPIQSKQNNSETAIEFAQHAIELAEITANNLQPVERDFIRAYWLLASAYRLDGQLELAQRHLQDSLMRARIINLIEVESDILLDLARLRYDQKKYEEAKSLAEEALSITERCGYVLQGADVNLFLATLALEGYTLERFKFDGKRELSDNEVATLHAETALKLAHCDGPPYYYKVAYEEAERLLASLNV
jgi:tetratricopeptide (TPR) repeat protein